MKRITILICSLFVCHAAFAALDNRAYNHEISEIVWKKSPGRWTSQVNSDVVAPLVEDWARTNAPANQTQVLILNRWRMLLAAMNEEWKTFDTAYGVLAAETNQAARVRQYDDAIRFLGNLHLNTPAALRIGAVKGIERLLVDSAADFSDARKMELHATIAVKGVIVYRDRAKAGWDRHFDTVKAMNDVPPHRSRALGAMLNGLFPLGREVAREAYEKNVSLIGEAEENAYLLAYAAACREANDRENFDRTVERIAAFKPGRRARPHADILMQMSAFDMRTARELLDAALADAALQPEDRAIYLDTKLKLYEPRVFNYGQNEPGVYETWKKTLIERMPLPSFNMVYLNGYTGQAIDFEDYVFAGELVEKGLAKYADSAPLLAKRGKLRALEGDLKGAAEDFTKASQGKGFERDTSAVLFTNIAVYLTDKSYPKDDIKALRQLSRWLYDMRLYDDCRALQTFWSEKLLLPRETKRHTVVFDADAPRSAEGFVRSKYYNDWKGMETRFEKYGADYHMRANCDTALLAASPNIKPDPKYPTGVKAIADLDGVHIFARCDDPEIDEVKTGKRKNAGSLEMFFEPGDHEVPYHSIFFEGLPGLADSADVVWAMPGRNFRRSTDFITKDAVLTSEGAVAHIFIPWVACYDTLPFDGRHWIFGLYRWHPGGGQCLGGMVHALGRGLKLDFPFDAATIKSLKSRIAATAFNRYVQQRDDKGDFIQRWDDELLGDPEFFAQEVKPLLERLDKAGETLDQSEIPAWAEIRYEISDRRVKYLKRQLMTVE
jgi:hypothetical protein